MKKPLSIASAAILGVSAIMLLIIPQYYESRINELRDENADMTVAQREAQHYMILANSENELAGLQRDHLDILIRLNLENGELQKKQAAILNHHMQAALHSLNASAAAKVVTADESDEVAKRLAALSDLKQIDAFYLKYFALAANGTISLDERESSNTRKVNRLTVTKNVLWHIAVFLQLAAFVLAILVIGSEGAPRRKAKQAQHQL